MKRSGYIALAILCLLQSGGLLFLHQFSQCIARLEMKQVLRDPETRYEKITVSIHDFEEGKINADEMVLHGKMYDIKAFHTTGNQVEILAVWDPKEERLVEKIKKLIGLNSWYDSKMANQLFVLLSLVYISSGSGNAFLFPESKSREHLNQAENICYRPAEISSPPPENI